MVAGEEEQNKEEPKGFAGLSSLVSDVDTSPQPLVKSEAASSAASSSAERRSASERQHPEPEPKTKQQPYQAPSQPPSGSSAGKWVLGIMAAVIGVLWLMAEVDKSPPSPASSYSPPARSTAPSYSAAPAQPQVPSGPNEAKPPVGQDVVFSTAQIRYCLAEDIRIEGARSVLNNYNDSDVDRFNAMVADYNSRCGSFRYRSGALESARRDVEPHRSRLQAEGRSRFARSPSAGSSPAPTPARPAANETVRAVQQKLNELGYNAGPTDGLMGRNTRAAIIAFQQDRGLTDTGVADQGLLLQLQQSPLSSTRSEGDNNPVVQGTPSRTTPATTAPLNFPTSPGVERSGPPANSWVSGSNWYCNNGYRKVGNTCEKLNVPRNAWVSGPNWYCNNGFRKVGDQCAELNVPDNAWVSGSNWYCNDGYRKVGESCVSVYER